MKISKNIKMVLKHIFFLVLSAIISTILTTLSQQNFGTFTVTVGLLCQALLNVWDQWDVIVDPPQNTSTPTT